MAALDLRGLIQVGFDIMNTTIDAVTRKITVQLGSVTDETADSATAELWQDYGMVSRMPRPDPGKSAAQAVVIRTGDYDLVIASMDLRGLELYGNLDYGEVAIYSAGEDGKGQARILLKKTGAISAYVTKGNVAGGAGMIMSLEPQTGTVRLTNDLGFGMVADKDGTYLSAGKAALKLGADGDIGLISKGGKVQIDGGGIVLGSLAVPGLNSALTGVTGVAGKASLKTLIE